LAEARALVKHERATLATLDEEGWPYASLVMVAPDPRNLPLLLLSDLAQHTKNIERDARAALLFDGTAGMTEPLAGPRLTVMGRMAPAPEAEAMAGYLACHPGAAAWARFGDFHLYRLHPAKAHLVAGFGRIAWIAPNGLFSREE
jgi:hypothetical protein